MSLPIGTLLLVASVLTSGTSSEFQLGGKLRKQSLPNVENIKDLNIDLTLIIRDYSSEKGWNMFVIGIAEFRGTAVMVFFLCMANVSFSEGRDSTAVAPIPFHIAISSGLVFASVIQLIAHISGSYLNPSVTLAAFIIGKIKIDLVIVYVLSECVGGLVGFGLLQALTPVNGTNFDNCDLCITSRKDEVTLLQAVLMEGIATSVLILMVCLTWDRRNSENLDSAPLKFGLYVTIVAFLVGPYTGGSMNPARSLAPAVWKGYWTDHWIYWVGPLGGSLITSVVYLYLFGRHVFPEQAVETPTHETLQEPQENGLKEIFTL